MVIKMSFQQTLWLMVVIIISLSRVNANTAKVHQEEGRLNNQQQQNVEIKNMLNHGVNKTALKAQVLEMFNHAYNSYMSFAYPADELMPLSCRGRVRGEQPSRGDIDDSLGKFSLTLIDTLDTLALLGYYKEFEKAVQLVIKDVSFDTDIVVSLFETNIRVLGGLLGGHCVALDIKNQGKHMQWYTDELLLMAKDIGYRMLPAFNTSTGIPYPRVNLRFGVEPGKSRTGKEKDTCTACAGTLLLEFATLSRLTGDPIFELKAKKATQELWSRRQRSSNLVGTVINIHNGEWVRRDSGVGAGIDSYYEYLLKAYVLLGEDNYLDWFTAHYEAVMRYVSNGPLLLDVHMHRPQIKAKNFMDSLLAFWPGLQVLFGDVKPAIEIHELLYQVMQKHNFLPEAFTPDYNIHWGQHPLRPEFTESTYFLYKATGDPYYLEVGKKIVDSLEQHARVPCGFAAIKDVRTGSHEDRMDSYVLAETFKYLYLLFAESDDLGIAIDDYLFTTEAHLLPLNLARLKIKEIKESHKEESSNDDPQSVIADRSCPNHNYLFPGGKLYAHTVRESLQINQRIKCDEKTSTKLKSSERRLKASEFIPGNGDQLQDLKRMGIRLVTMKDGRVQLMHTASHAVDDQSANDGMLFMQEMIELSKSQQRVEYHPCTVQLVQPDSVTNIVLQANPAQFGLDLVNNHGILAHVVSSVPANACSTLLNADSVHGHIALVTRGECMFIEKARTAQQYGAVGVIVIDKNKAHAGDETHTFAMSGDGSVDVTLPVVFLFYKEAQMLLDALQQYPEQLLVALVDKANSPDEIEVLKSGYLLKNSDQEANIHLNAESTQDGLTQNCIKTDYINHEGGVSTQCQQTVQTQSGVGTQHQQTDQTQGSVSTLDKETDQTQGDSGTQHQQIDQTQGSVHTLGQQTNQTEGNVGTLGQQTDHSEGSAGTLGQQTDHSEGSAGTLGQKTDHNEGSAGTLGQQRDHSDGSAGTLGQQRDLNEGSAGTLGQQRDHSDGSAGTLGQQTDHSEGSAGTLGQKTDHSEGSAGTLGQHTDHNVDNEKSEMNSIQKQNDENNAEQDQTILMSKYSPEQLQELFESMLQQSDNDIDDEQLLSHIQQIQLETLLEIYPNSQKEIEILQVIQTGLRNIRDLQNSLMLAEKDTKLLNDEVWKEDITRRIYEQQSWYEERERELSQKQRLNENDLPIDEEESNNEQKDEQVVLHQEL